MRGRDGVRARARDRVGARRDALGSSRRACLVPVLALFCVLAAPPTAIAQYPAAEAYVAKATVSPSSADRTYGAAVAADDGRVATLVGLGSVEVTHFASADATAADAERATLALDDDDVSATGLEDRRASSILAMRDGLVVLGAPGRGGGAGGARVWRLDTSDTKPNENTWNSTSFVDLGSSDGARNKVGVSAATAGGAVIALGAPSDDKWKGAVYVFLDSDGDGEGDRAFTTAPTKITAPTRAEGDRFGASVEVSHGVVGPGNGWLVVAAPGADAGAGAVFATRACRSRGPPGRPRSGTRTRRRTRALPRRTTASRSILGSARASRSRGGSYSRRARRPSAGRVTARPSATRTCFCWLGRPRRPSRLTRRART